jgi:hypothetical protein
MNFGFLLSIRLWASAVECLCLVIGNGASDGMPPKKWTASPADLADKRLLGSASFQRA